MANPFLYRESQNNSGNVIMTPSNTNVIRNKMRAIAANVTGCKMDQVRLRLQYEVNSNGCRTTGRGCSKNRLGGGMYGTAYKAYASKG